MSGELLLKFDRVNNSNNYSVQTAESPNGPWEDQDLSTSTRVTIAGLTPGKSLLGARLRERFARLERIRRPCHGHGCLALDIRSKECRECASARGFLLARAWA